MKTYPDPSYFFDRGIRFECTQCGNCCTGAPGQVRVTEDEISRIADYLKINIEEMKKTCVRDKKLIEKANGDCIFYDKGCSIYSVRPTQCRTYPFWFKNLRSEEAWAATCKSCPGIGHGRLYSKEEILRLIDLTL